MRTVPLISSLLLAITHGHTSEASEQRASHPVGDTLTEYLPYPHLSCPDSLDHVQVLGDDNSTLLHYALVPSCPLEANNGILCARLEVPTEAWIGFGISQTGSMIGSQAVIGLPANGTVLKYNLVAKGGDEPCAIMNETKQTLMNATIAQENGTTIMSFAKLLMEEGEISILEDGFFLVAEGSGNELGYHANKMSFTMDVGGEVTATTTTTAATSLPRAASAKSGKAQEGGTNTKENKRKERNKLRNKTTTAPTTSAPNTSAPTSTSSPTPAAISPPPGLNGGRPQGGTHARERRKKKNKLRNKKRNKTGNKMMNKKKKKKNKLRLGDRKRNNGDM